MSTKNWKNQELKSLLSEAWGFKMDLSKLNEEALKEFAAERGPPPEVPEEKGKKCGEGEKPDGKGGCVPASPTDQDRPMGQDPLEEMGCGDHGGAPEDMEVMVMGGGADGAPGMEMPAEESDPQTLAAKAIEAIQALADAAGAGGQGQGINVEEPKIAERRGRGRDREGMEADARRRPMSEAQLDAVVARILKNTTKGK